MDEVYCAITGRRIENLSDAIYDDGDWISWEGIHEHEAKQELRQQFPNINIPVVEILEGMVEFARDYKLLTGRYLQIWGELGELYGEAYFGIVRHKPHTAGSDGRLGNDWIEVKTISPEKSGDEVHVKRAGNFNKLLVVRISEDFDFEARMYDRAALRKGSGKHARIRWRSGSGDVDAE